MTEENRAPYRYDDSLPAWLLDVISYCEELEDQASKAVGDRDVQHFMRGQRVTAKRIRRHIGSMWESRA